MLVSVNDQAESGQRFAPVRPFRGKMLSMPDSRAATSDADVEQEIERIADELYALKPDEFMAARDEQVRAAKGEGKAQLARELGKLRKPTLSAWLINLLWRDQREVMEQLFELAAELNRAQAEASGPAMRELMAQRRQIEAALLKRAAALAQQAGVKVTDQVVREAQETLTAALAQPEIADEVRTGRLVKPAEYAGFGAPAAVSAAPRTAPAPAQPKPRSAEPVSLQEAAERRRAQERRAAAERRVAEARAGVDSAARTLAEQQRSADAAHTRHDDLLKELDQLRDRVRRLEREADEAQRAAAVADRERERADKAHAAAQDALDAAEGALRELS